MTTEPMNEAQIYDRIKEINRYAAELKDNRVLLTSAQVASLLAMHDSGSKIYSFYNCTLMGSVMVQSSGIVIGIEPDGYRHS